MPAHFEERTNYEVLRRTGPLKVLNLKGGWNREERERKRKGKEGGRGGKRYQLVASEVSLVLETPGSSHSPFWRPEPRTVTGSSRSVSISLNFKYTFPRQTLHSSLSKEAILSLWITPAVNLDSSKRQHWGPGPAGGWRELLTNRTSHLPTACWMVCSLGYCVLNHCDSIYTIVTLCGL